MTRVAVFTDAPRRTDAPFSTVITSLHATGLDLAVYDEVAVEPTDASSTPPRASR